MTTTVIKTIGTGGDYTDLSTWFAACPADISAATGNNTIQQAQLLNQEFTGSGSLLTLSGKTVDASGYFEITAAAGASFADNANKLTNALRYNTANGAALRVTGNYQPVILVQLSNTRINRLQFATGSSNSTNTLRIDSSSITGCDVNQCIFEGYCSQTTVGSDVGVVAINRANTIRNSLVVQKRNSTSVYAAEIGFGASAINCTFVSIGNTGAVGIGGNLGTTTLKNCYVGGVTAVTGGTTTFSVTNCQTSLASATGWTGSVALSTANFQNVTSGTHDFRLLSGSALIDAAVNDSTYAANDIIGTARPQGSVTDVGAWEFSATGTTISPSSGHGVVAGHAPSLSQSANQSVSPSVAHAVVAGYAPSVAQSANQSVSPSSGLVVFTGYAPSLNGSSNLTLTPIKGEFALTGYAPFVAQNANQAVSPSPGHVVLAGKTPALSQSASQVLSPGAGHIAITGKVPVIITSGVFVTPEPLVNNTGTPWSSTAVHWTRVNNGRIGDMGSATITDGSGATDASGYLALTGQAAGTGYLMIAKWNTGTADDDVYYVPCTVT